VNGISSLREEHEKNMSARSVLGKAFDAFCKNFDQKWFDSCVGSQSITLVDLKEHSDPMFGVEMLLLTEIEMPLFDCGKGGGPC